MSRSLSVRWLVVDGSVPDQNSFIVSKSDIPFQILSLLYELFSLFFSRANITNPVKDILTKYDSTLDYVPY